MMKKEIANREPFTKELNFNIPRKYMLNANQSLHHMQKANITKYLKNLGYEVGYENLPEDRKKIIYERKIILDKEDNNKILRGRITKQIKKENPSLTTKEINLKREEIVSKTLGEIDPNISSSNIEISPLFNFFSIDVIISTPTKRRFDPPNLYPTVKGLVDGLTYAGYWIDDDWRHIESMNFIGDPETSQEKDIFKIKLIIKEIV